MKTFTEKYDVGMFGGGIFDRYFSGLTPCVFDIETTGLSRISGRVIMTAMLTPSENGVKLTQFLAETPYEEREVLAATCDFMEDEGVDYLITYNGDSFDIPFFNARATATVAGSELGYYNFDLFRFIKRCTVLPVEIGAVTQKNVENFLGIGDDREDEISGKESIALFYRFTSTKDAKAESDILRHNREDVLQLLKLMHAMGKEDFRRVLKTADLHEAMAATGFPVGHLPLSIRPSLSGKGEKIALDISGRSHRMSGRPVDSMIFPAEGSEMRAEFKNKTGSLTIHLPLSVRDDCVYADLKGLGFGASSSDPLGIRDMGGYVNDFLILFENGAMRHEEINALSVMLAYKIYRDML